MLKPEGSWLFPVQQHFWWLQHVAPDAVTVSDPEDFAPWLTMVQQATHPQHRPTNLGSHSRRPTSHRPGMTWGGASVLAAESTTPIRDTHSQYCLMKFWFSSRMMAHLRSSKRCCRGMKTPCSPINGDTGLRRQATTRRDAFVSQRYLCFSLSVRGPTRLQCRWTAPRPIVCATAPEVPFVSSWHQPLLSKCARAAH